jgi:hypothetical protein
MVQKTLERKIPCFYVPMKTLIVNGLMDGSTTKQRPLDPLPMSCVNAKEKTCGVRLPAWMMTVK